MLGRSCSAVLGSNFVGEELPRGQQLGPPWTTSVSVQLLLTKSVSAVAPSSGTADPAGMTPIDIAAVRRATGVRQLAAVA